jgi:signal transduction histidine kinase
MYISLKIKIWLFVNLFVLSITVFAYFYFPFKERQYHQQVIDKEIDYMAKTIATGITIALSDGNFHGITTSMDYARSDNRLRFVALTQIDTVVSGGKTKAETKILKVYPANTNIKLNVSSDDNTIVKRENFRSEIMNGQLIIGFSTAEINQNVTTLKQSIMGAGIFIFILSSIVSYFASRTITKPLHHLRDATLKIGTGNLDLNLNLNRRDEIGDLSKSFDHMVKEIDKYRKNLKQQKSQLLRANRELKDLNNEKNNLISIVSHDLRSPLNQMKGLLALIRLQNTELDEETIEYLNKATKSADRMNDLIVKILNVDALESPLLNLNMEEVSLSEVIDQSFDHYHRVASEKEIRLLKSEFISHKMVFADRHFATLVLDNLLSNAIKFSPRNSVVSLVVPEEDVDQFVRVEVQDQGPGITLLERDKLFTRYQRLSAKPTAGESSIGLGLSIVKRYMDMMNGEVLYEDGSPGSRFVVKFRKA